ncbi:50S ribosomal protein L22 [Candidatus Peregrinibacteria bacterium]|nr:50S ribosomal protein L22 [Candidatus Peregrinibacteria bacterium]MBT7337271.1 50S ribosomal protein L22 [Candidatus Peregrinibacteria bacterium]
MNASLKAIRIAPKKAQLVAKMIRGKSVPDAMYTLERTNKKAARLLEGLLRSAMANASHNEKQDPQMMMVKTLIVNKAQCYHRGVPMARGRVRPMRKFMSHIELTLGVSQQNTSQTAKKTVKKTTTSTKKSTSTKSKSTPKKDTTASTSKSSTSTKKPAAKKPAAKKTTPKKS